LKGCVKLLIELTAEQKKLMEEVRNEWINRFNSLEFDEEKAKELMDFLYSFIEFKPKFKLILDSPLALQIACNILRWFKQSIKIYW